MQQKCRVIWVELCAFQPTGKLSICMKLTPTIHLNCLNPCTCSGAVETYWHLVRAWRMSSRSFMTLVQHVYDNDQIQISTHNDYNVVCRVSIRTVPHYRPSQLWRWSVSMTSLLSTSCWTMSSTPKVTHVLLMPLEVSTCEYSRSYKSCTGLPSRCHMTDIITSLLRFKQPPV